MTRTISRGAGSAGPCSPPGTSIVGGPADEKHPHPHAQRGSRGRRREPARRDAPVPLRPARVWGGRVDVWQLGAGMARPLPAGAAMTHSLIVIPSADKEFVSWWRCTCGATGQGSTTYSDHVVG